MAGFPKAAWARFCAVVRALASPVWTGHHLHADAPSTGSGFEQHGIANGFGTLLGAGRSKGVVPLPGMTGTPTAWAIWRAIALSPMVSMTSGVGPMKIKPAS